LEVIVLGVAATGAEHISIARTATTVRIGITGYFFI
jgi:hypothetical protein